MLISPNACSTDPAEPQYSPWRLGWGTIAFAEEGMLYDSQEQSYQRRSRGGGVTPCGYIFQGMQCHNVVDIQVGGIHFGPWTRWAQRYRITIPGHGLFGMVWCRARVAKRVVSRRQMCRTVWQKNCPPYDTRYGPWRMRNCDVEQTRRQLECCDQVTDPATSGGCTGRLFRFWELGSNWQDSRTLGCEWD